VEGNQAIQRSSPILPTKSCVRTYAVVEAKRLALRPSEPEAGPGWPRAGC